MLKHRKLRARLWLVFIFCALAAGNFLFFRFSFHELNPFPITRGLAFGSSLFSAALIVALWLRLGWARYVLSAWLALAMFGFGFAVLMMHSRSSRPVPVPAQTAKVVADRVAAVVSAIPLPEPTKEAVLGLLLYGVALVPLGLSRSLRRYSVPRTAGGA